ncbi:hypothetical protein [Plebeiibacterium marinum]|uniref:Outer membrane protein beta-barrel domain-containing protein n=1 Tax=Plebeiibacterium marinum TaxID=2992111 RepID=A0AAE3SIG5_9BACT|nr:hypothetical protein [Plebeiobacterium marinum]MCW3804413.1 hypothetical protein [Plebeiobacterium marinum]
MKKIKMLFACVMLGVFCIPAHGQEEKKTGGWDWGIHSSITPYVDTDVKTLSFIRKDIDTYDDYYYDYVDGTFYTWDVGLTLEKGIVGDHLVFTTGLNYNNVVTGLDADDYGASSFMLINVSNASQQIEFLRASSFEQKAHYVGVPVGLKFYPISDHFFNFYVKAAVDVNILVAHKVDTKFINPSMEKYNNKVEDLFGDPASVFSTLNVAGGIKLGKKNQPRVTLDVGPSFLLSGDPSSLTQANVGFTFKLNFLLPL